MLAPSPDAFRALARSSPWRWTSVHLRHRSHLLALSGRGGEVEAWLTRPDGVRVVGADGRPRGFAPGEDPDGSPSGPWRPPEPSWRPDGLVDRRPVPSWAPDVLGDGLFWTNYAWVAMLDPVELSHHVEVHDPHQVEVAGRPAWQARLVALPGYEPRCGGNCCELLWSEAGLRSDFPTDDDVPEGWSRGPYPDAYDVALDVATGIVVRCLPVGGPETAPWLENDVLSSR